MPRTIPKQTPKTKETGMQLILMLLHQLTLSFPTVSIKSLFLISIASMPSCLGRQRSGKSTSSLCSPEDGTDPLELPLQGKCRVRLHERQKKSLRSKDHQSNYVAIGCGVHMVDALHKMRNKRICNCITGRTTVIRVHIKCHFTQNNLVSMQCRVNNC